MDRNEYRWFSLDTSKKPPTPLILLFSLDALLILSYTVRSSPYRSWIFIPPIFGIGMWILLCTHPGRKESDLSLVTQIGVGNRVSTTFLMAVANILLSNPQENVVLLGFSTPLREKDSVRKISPLKSVSSTSETATAIPVSAEPFLRRLWWGVIFWGNPRGINYAHEPTAYLPPRPSRSYTKLSFIRRQVCRILFHLVLMELCTLVLEVYNSKRLAAQASQQSMGLWMFLSISYFVNMYGMLEYLYDIISIISVGLGITTPSDWPPYNNSPREAYTIRRFWGKFWPQTYRRIFRLYGKFMQNLLGIPTRTTASAYLKLVVAFIMSALLHYAGDAITFQTLSTFGSMKFFLLQPLVILLEDTVIRGGSRIFRQRRSSTLTKSLGYLWVLAFFGLSSPLWIDDQLDSGYVASLPETFPRLLTRGSWAHKTRLRASYLVILEGALFLYTIESTPRAKLFAFIPMVLFALWILLCTQGDDKEYNLWTQLFIGHRTGIILLFSSTSLLESLKSSRHDTLSESWSFTTLWNAATTWINPRRINTTEESKHSLPPKPGTSWNNRRALFVIRQLLWSTFHFCLADASMIMLHFYDIRRKGKAASNAVSLWDVVGIAQPWRLASVAYMAAIYAGMSSAHYNLSAISIAAGISKPSDWPPMFNLPSEAYTLRRFWGTFWHQLFRKVFSTHGNFYAYLLRLPPRSMVTRYLTLFVAFALSGLMHLGGDSLGLQSVSKTGTLHFFMFQAIAIVIEDGVLAMASKFRKAKGRRQGPGLGSRILGLMWVLLWFCYSIPIWLNPLLDAGYVDTINNGSFSPITGIWKGLWFRQNSNTWMWQDTFRK